MHTVLTLQDLQNWSRPGTHLAVLGHPIQHSLSPLMHNAALAEMAARDPRFADWHYHRFDIHPDDLPRALELLHEKKFHGINLTVPHKIIAFERVAVIDPAARPIGAVNTLRWIPAGWHGYNTDGYGLTSAIRETLGHELAGTAVILLGAGGAARGAAVECLQRGCSALWIANRTRSKLDTLLADLQPLAEAGDTLLLRGFDPQSPTELAALPPRALIINATSAGLRDTDPAPLNLAQLPHPPIGVFDMVYNSAHTRLLADAAALRIPCANGLAMLMHQGARALEIWTETAVPVSTMRRAALDGLAAGK